jgi:hypothetical protein
MNYAALFAQRHPALNVKRAIAWSNWEIRYLSRIGHPSCKTAGSFSAFPKALGLPLVAGSA